MTRHYEDLIPFLVTGKLSEEESACVRQHLEVCESCKSEWDLWQLMYFQVNEADRKIQSPPELEEKTFIKIKSRPSIRKSILRAAGLLWSQAYLVRREMWPASAGIMALGIITVLLSKETAFLTFITPLVAAASLAAIYGPQNDPASELTMAAPISPWKILLARLTLVSGYNLLLALVSSVVLLAVIPVGLLGTLILSWLGPLTLLSALALFLSLWMGTSNAVTISYGLWIIQFIHAPRLLEEYPGLQVWDNFMASYRIFWQSPGLLIILAACMVLISLVSMRYTGEHSLQIPG